MKDDIVFRVCHTVAEVPAAQWDSLTAASPRPTPFMQHAFLLALENSGSATAETGWLTRYILAFSASGQLLAGCPLYIKTHSFGEYVFDHLWAHAYAQHGVPYYPKAVIAIPFTPVPGTRITGISDHHRAALLQYAVQYVQSQQLSSLHLLWGCAEDVKLFASLPDSDKHCTTREQIQFHWHNCTARSWRSYGDYLASLQQRKRKKIRAEQRRVQQAGIHWEFRQGEQIRLHDWQFFYRCYTQTYLEHGNAPYLSEDFFVRMHRHMPQNWLLCTAYRRNDNTPQPAACSLIALNPDTATTYGRYWGALERVDCLHFDACFHQPIAWCIRNGYRRFEGGAQGVHKMARGLLPTAWQSAHWIADPAFAHAIARHAGMERTHTSAVRQHLEQQSPFKLSA